MSDRDDLPMEEYHRAGLEITRGNPDVYKALYSRRDDITLANPFGPPVRGWQEVSARLDLAAGHYRDGEDFQFENISTVIASDLAYAQKKETPCPQPFSTCPCPSTGSSPGPMRDRTTASATAGTACTSGR
jgi:hypothetical protein